MYRQTVTIEELDDHGGARGQYREMRDVIFSPQHERTEEMVGKPQNGLKSLILTEEDFRDIRDIQPLVLTEDRLWNYETKFRGDETMDDVDCWVLQVRPRQILSGQRFFDGMIWVDKKEYNIVRMEGQAVPQIRTTKSGEPVSRGSPRFASRWTASTGSRSTPTPTTRCSFAPGRSASGCGSRTATTGGLGRNRPLRRSDGAAAHTAKTALPLDCGWRERWPTRRSALIRHATAWQGRTASIAASIARTRKARSNSRAAAGTRDAPKPRPLRAELRLSSP